MVLATRGRPRELTPPPPPLPPPGAPSYKPGAELFANMIHVAAANRPLSSRVGNGEEKYTDEHGGARNVAGNALPARHWQQLRRGFRAPAAPRLWSDADRKGINLSP